MGLRPRDPVLLDQSCSGVKSPAGLPVERLGPKRRDPPVLIDGMRLRTRPTKSLDLGNPLGCPAAIEASGEDPQSGWAPSA